MIDKILDHIQKVSKDIDSILFKKLMKIREKAHGDKEWGLYHALSFLERILEPGDRDIERIQRNLAGSGYEIDYSLPDPKINKEGESITYSLDPADVEVTVKKIIYKA